MSELILTSTNDLLRQIEEVVERALDERLPGQPHPPSDAWLSNRRAQKYLGVSKSTLHRERKSGRLPFSKVGARIYYRQADLDAYLERHAAGGAL